jgi:MYXO-CTERM domain-containing protein
MVPMKSIDRCGVLPASLLALLTFFSLSACSAPSDDVARGSTALSPSPNDQAAFFYFVGKGLTTYQAAGIVGNLDQESQVDPAAVESGGPGRGIAQWSVGGRWDTDANDNVVWYAGTQGASDTSLTLQLAFIWYELETFPDYGLASLRASANVTDATIAFETDFEGCGDCDQATRISDAELALATYGGADAASPPVSAADSGTAGGHEDAGAAGSTSDDDSGSTGTDPTGDSAAGDGGTSAGAGNSGAPALGGSGGGCAVAGASRTSSNLPWLPAVAALSFFVRRRRPGRVRSVRAA